MPVPAATDFARASLMACRPRKSPIVATAQWWILHDALCCCKIKPLRMERGNALHEPDVTYGVLHVQYYPQLPCSPCSYRQGEGRGKARHLKAEEAIPAPVCSGPLQRPVKATLTFCHMQECHHAMHRLLLWRVMCVRRQRQCSRCCMRSRRRRCALLY